MTKIKVIVELNNNIVRGILHGYIVGDFKLLLNVKKIVQKGMFYVRHSQSWFDLVIFITEASQKPVLNKILPV